MITSRGAGGARIGRSLVARGWLAALVLGIAAGLALLASACGGSSGEGIAQAGSTETTSNGSGSTDGSSSADPTAYAACMRRNGVPTFPDPDSQGRLSIQGGPGLDPNSPRFKAAEKKCQRFMPRGSDQTPSPQEQAAGLREALRYSACIREHGVPNFPDPKLNAEGGIGLDGGSGGGFNPDSPQFKAAEKACQKLAPGAGPGGSVRSSRAPGATP
jgi:hypothetical protein